MKFQVQMTFTVEAEDQDDAEMIIDMTMEGSPDITDYSYTLHEVSE